MSFVYETKLVANWFYNKRENKEVKIMKKQNIIFPVLALLAVTTAMAQSSAPAPGAGGGFNPNPPNGIGWNPGPMVPGGNSAPAPGSGGSFNPAPPAWGGPWGGGWQSSPSVIVNSTPGFISGMNQGTCNVVGVGYDAQGVWRTVPMTVAYNWNGAQYNTVVLNAWNPWTDMWNRDIDSQAYNTSYFLNGVTYNFYVVLPTGTFYFNL